MRSKITYFLLLLVVIISGFFLWQKKATQTAPEPVKNQELDISVCDPKNNNFSLTSTNIYFPLLPGKQNILEDETSKVQITVLNETKLIEGVETRVVEEKEWENDQLVEISRNYYVEASDGTVCYFGEDVDIYQDGKVVSHEGAWIAGEGNNRPGIMMPGKPGVGQTYKQEVAAPVAMDSALHVSLGESFTVPAGSFADILLVEETPPSTKRYAPGVGLIFDAGAVLTQHD